MSYAVWIALAVVLIAVLPAILRGKKGGDTSTDSGGGDSASWDRDSSDGDSSDGDSSESGGDSGGSDSGGD